MDMNKQAYRRFADAHAPRSPIVKDSLHAFLVGGAICTLAQGVRDVYVGWCGLSAEDAGLLTSVTLILVAALLTGLGIFPKIAKFAGAGTLVPITGFANAVAAPAIDFKSEGLVTGTAARIFTVAGPVIAFGTLSSALYGLILWMTALP
jgi:stage V sporulation protein AC